MMQPFVSQLICLIQVPLKRVLVVYDDLDMETANVRLRGKGGHGGHNGMRSILSSMNGSEFPRIKVGEPNFPRIA